MNYLDLGSTYQFSEAVLEPGDMLVEVCDDGTFCYDAQSFWGDEIPEAHQLFGDYVVGLPFPSNFFDKAAGSCFLEHYEPDMSAAFKEVARVLKPGGLLTVKGCGAASRRYYDDALAAGFEIVTPATIYAEDLGDEWQWGYDRPYTFQLKGGD